MKFTLVILCAGILIFFSGCYKSLIKIEGNHNVVTETRTMPPFNKIYNEGDFDVYIIQDSVFEVTIEAESNLIPYIRTIVGGTTLRIDTRDNLRNHFPMKLFIRTPDINVVELSGSGLIRADEIHTNSLEAGISGSGNIYMNAQAELILVNISGSGSVDMGVEAETLNVSISGSGDMYFWGETHTGKLNISGSGSIKAYELVQDDCFARISGSGSMYIHVIDYLDVNISGSGSVYYTGNPVLVTKITGSGSVIRP